MPQAAIHHIQPLDALPGMSGVAAARAAGLRNILNVAEAEDWLARLADEKLGTSASVGSADPRSEPARVGMARAWLASVGRNWLIREGEALDISRPRATLAGKPASEDNPLPEWVAKAWAEGKSAQRLALGEADGQKLAGILDWLRAEDGPSLASDWSRISMRQALASEQAWIDSMAKAAAMSDMDAFEAAGTRFFCPSQASAFEGLGAERQLSEEGAESPRWVEVFSKESLNREGSLMRHCVGSYANDVSSGAKTIYSLRDAQNKPLLTIEARKGAIVQLKAFANGPCPKELFPAVALFAKKFTELCGQRSWKAESSQEAEAAGIVALKGFGFAVRGEPIPSAWEAALDEDLDVEGSASDLLPKLAALGWADAVRKAAPKARPRSCAVALQAASLFGQPNIIEILLPYSDAKYNDSLALGLAADNGHLECVALLLPHSDPKARASDAFGKAAGNGHLEIVKLLLPRSNVAESMALFRAASSGHLATVELLMNYDDHKNFGAMAFRVAASAGHLAIIDLFLARYDNPSEVGWLRSIAAGWASRPCMDKIESHARALEAQKEPAGLDAESKLSSRRSSQITAGNAAVDPLALNAGARI